MNSSSPLITRITARFIPMHTCTTCGVIKPGDRSIEVQTISLEELQTRLNMPAPRSTIPVGWASNGVHGVSCDKCTEQ